MRFRDDERAVTVQIGAVLLLGFVVISMSMYQATVVPDQNEEIEFQHNQQVHDEFTSLRGALVESASGPTTRPAELTLGTRYPSRTFFVNPGVASGSLRTRELGTFTVSNVATREDETDDYVSGSLKFSTESLAYTPNYNRRQEAPTTVYENTVAYNRFDSGYNGTLSGQSLVNGRTLSPVLLTGNYSESGVGTASVDVRSVSPAVRTVPVTSNDSNRNVTLTVPTELTASNWTTILESAEQLDGSGNTANGAYVHDVRPGPGDSVVIEMERGPTYDLRVGAVGVGNGVEQPSAHYLTRVGGAPYSIQSDATATLTFEVRDRYNNPLSGESVNLSVQNGSGDLVAPNGTESGTLSNVRTDADGRVTVEYVPDGTETVEIRASFDKEPSDGSYDGSSRSDVTTAFEVYAAGSGGGGDSSSLYDLEWHVDEIVSQDGVSESGSSDVDIVIDQSVVGNTVDMTARATSGTDRIAGVGVDYASNDSAVVSFDGENTEGTTESDGRSTAAMSVLGADDRAKVYASAAEDSDVLTVELVGEPSGLYYRYYEGDFGSDDQPSDLDLDNRTPEKTGNVPQFSISPRDRGDDIAFAFTGYIDVPSDGQYTFYTNSDDGSWLYIDGDQVVDNGGEHAVQEASGTVTLDGGRHNITVYFYENRGEEVLTVSWLPPGGTKEEVPSSVLSPRTPSAGDSGGGDGSGSGGTAASSVSYVSDSGLAKANGGPTSGAQFKIRNDGSDSVTVTNIQIETGASQARQIREDAGGEYQDGQHEVFIDASTDGLLEMDGGPPYYGDTGTPYRLGDTESLTQDAILNSGSQATIYMYQFQNNGGSPVDMTNSEVTVTLTYADGSSETITFTATDPY
ncbi:PA14 domain-containing protein [Halopelagius inordinatus]|uniref:PA14 domain-containing protein n=1 Tax=Halopelagius inordinatus TaxID=553467 RepID=A0A1I2RU18_9EURY|nr:PA14 domain-containing protein [Halopelagius inordinatus]SFG43960.1 PA14 domain-containing protein [Halopelagius inordinatus]